jgi:hypothetical protein
MDVASRRTETPHCGFEQRVPARRLVDRVGISLAEVRHV